MLFLKYCGRTSLAVQWLRLHAPTAGGAGSIPGQGTKILHAAPCGQKKTKKREKIYHGNAFSLLYFISNTQVICTHKKKASKMKTKVIHPTAEELRSFQPFS